MCWNMHRLNALTWIYIPYILQGYNCYPVLANLKFHYSGRITGTLWGESIGDRWTPLVIDGPPSQRTSNAESRSSYLHTNLPMDHFYLVSLQTTPYILGTASVSSYLWSCWWHMSTKCEIIKEDIVIWPSMTWNSIMLYLNDRLHRFLRFFIKYCYNVLHWAI